MNIDLDENVKPFFQVLVSVCKGDVTASTFFRKFKAVISATNNHSAKNYVSVEIPPNMQGIEEDDFLAAILKHKSVPTWYIQEEKIDMNAGTRNLILDIEHDLFIFYRNGEHYFFSTNCGYLFSLIQSTLDKFLEEDNIKFAMLTGAQLNHILSQFDIEYRSLGIQNHFAMGGIAADGKTYYSKNASNSLTPSFDSGYGFSYCIGAFEQTQGRKTPFGCSKGKSKIWTTWVRDLDEFCISCDNIVKWLNDPKKANDQLDVLVQSTHKNIIPKLNPVEFFLDYYALEKGLVFLASENYTLNWDCHLIPETNKVFFEIREGDTQTTTEIEFNYDLVDETYTFSYCKNQPEIWIAIAPSEEQITARRVFDLVEFLNKQKNFTILYDEPYSYRDDECWEDNRLKKIFYHVSGEMDWTDVDIRKEDLKAAAGKKNILEKIQEHFKADSEVIFSCNDNGANEIADYLVVYENRVILIHAKYASDNEPKLLIGDIQVVASQTAKNVRFFLPAAYSPEILQRLYNNSTFKGRYKTLNEFKKDYLKILNSKDTIRECWIVQPGISLPQLKKETNNKMHTILNFIYSALRVNGVEFKLIANSAEKKVKAPKIA